MHKKKHLKRLSLFLFFRDRLAKHEIATTNELEAIFSNINDLIELTLTLIGSLEDNLEMAEEGKAPAVGTCFEELAEAEDFDVYENYARDILDPRCQRTLEGLLGNFLFHSSLSGLPRDPDLSLPPSSGNNEGDPSCD